MKRSFAAALIATLAIAPLYADVTMVQTMAIEGGPAAAMAGGVPLPKITLRIKGQRSRSDVEMNGTVISSIADVAGNRIIMLNSATKTATITTPGSLPADAAPVQLPKVDFSLTPTGKLQTIDGHACEEHAIAMSLDMSAMLGGAGQLPPEAAAAMKDVRMVMNGSLWVSRTAPGAAEMMAFNQAAAKSKLIGVIAGMVPGMSGGFDKLMEAAAGAPGVPYLTEISMAFEGSGPMVDMMKQMGAMKMTQKVASLSTESLSDDLFTIPEGYKVEGK